MDPLTDRLLRLLQAHHGWRRYLLLIQEDGGRAGWVKLPDDLDLALRLNTDDTVSITLGHRDPGEAFLAELEALVAETEAECSTASTAWATGPAEPSPAASDGRQSHCHRRVLPGDGVMPAGGAREFATDRPRIRVRSSHVVAFGDPKAAGSLGFGTSEGANLHVAPVGLGGPKGACECTGRT